MKVAVFCGSKSGNHPSFAMATRELGYFFAQQNIDVVYGGGRVGLMGIIADATLEKGGKVYGVIPEYLKEKELAHKGLTELITVADMHERKATMAERADAFVALPGGAGTLEEIFEAWTWAQLGYHQKPCAFYNVAGYYDALLTLVDNMQQAGFINPTYVDMLIRSDSPADLLTAFRQYQPPENKW